MDHGTMDHRILENAEFEWHFEPGFGKISKPVPILSFEAGQSVLWKFPGIWKSYSFRCQNPDLLPKSAYGWKIQSRKVILCIAVIIKSTAQIFSIIIFQTKTSKNKKMTIRFWKSGSEGSVSSGDSSSQNSDVSSAEDETVEVTRVKSIKITPGIGKFDWNFNNWQYLYKMLIFRMPRIFHH